MELGLILRRNNNSWKPSSLLSGSYDDFTATVDMTRYYIGPDARVEDGISNMIFCVIHKYKGTKVDKGLFDRAIPFFFFLKNEMTQVPKILPI